MNVEIIWDKSNQLANGKVYMDGAVIGLLRGVGFSPKLGIYRTFEARPCSSLKDQLWDIGFPTRGQESCPLDDAVFYLIGYKLGIPLVIESGFE